MIDRRGEENEWKPNGIKRYKICRIEVQKPKWPFTVCDQDGGSSERESNGVCGITQLILKLFFYKL